MFHLQFTTDNAAFEGDGLKIEVVTILGKIAKAVCDDRFDGPIVDTNGNRIGEWSLTNPEEAED